MMRNAEEMTVTVNKKELLDILGANRKTHDQDFDKAISGWKKAAVEALRHRADKIDAGEDLELHFNIPKPTNHVKDYDNAIQMLELHVEETIKLGFAVYQQFVQDDWDWKQHFGMVSAQYMG